MATCSSPHSRNRHVGEELGKGRSLDDVLSGMQMVAEGVGTTASILELADRGGIELPICEQVGAVLSGRLPPTEVVSQLMQRKARTEFHDFA
jgi:glycerol-3-phosphate dehydrogenase (NAD(P)+)